MFLSAVGLTFNPINESIFPTFSAGIAPSSSANPSKHFFRTSTLNIKNREFIHTNYSRHYFNIKFSYDSLCCYTMIILPVQPPTPNPPSPLVTINQTFLQFVAFRILIKFLQLKKRFFIMWSELWVVAQNSELQLIIKVMHTFFHV